MNIPYTAAHGAIRFSFSRDNSDADVDAVLEAVPPIIGKLREISPFWREADSGKGTFNPAYA
jgi:cysteine desulfurase